MSIFDRLFVKSSSRKTTPVRKRQLRLETLESRELLSVNPLGLDGTAYAAKAAFVAAQADTSVPENAPQSAAAASFAQAASDTQVPPVPAGYVQLLPVGTNELYANDDESTGLVNLGFNFNYFGNTYSSCYINNNGNITFNSSVRDFIPQGFGSYNSPMIAPFWADVDTRSTGSVHYTTGMSSRGNAVFQVDWSDVGYYSYHSDKTNDFTLYIENDPNGVVVAFVYRNMDWIDTDTSTNAEVGFAGDSVNYISYGSPDTLAELASFNNAEVRFRFDSAGNPHLAGLNKTDDHTFMLGITSADGTEGNLTVGEKATLKLSCENWNQVLQEGYNTLKIVSVRVVITTENGQTHNEDITNRVNWQIEWNLNTAADIVLREWTPIANGNAEFICDFELSQSAAQNAESNALGTAMRTGQYGDLLPVSDTIRVATNASIGIPRNLLGFQVLEQTDNSITVAWSNLDANTIYNVSVYDTLTGKLVRGGNLGPVAIGGGLSRPYDKGFMLQGDGLAQGRVYEFRLYKTGLLPPFTSKSLGTFYASTKQSVVSATALTFIIEVDDLLTSLNYGGYNKFGYDYLGVAYAGGVNTLEGIKNYEKSSRKNENILVYDGSNIGIFNDVLKKIYNDGITDVRILAKAPTTAYADRRYVDVTDNSAVLAKLLDKIGERLNKKIEVDGLGTISEELYFTHYYVRSILNKDWEFQNPEQWGVRDKGKLLTNAAEVLDFLTNSSIKQKSDIAQVKEQLATATFLGEDWFLMASQDSAYHDRFYSAGSSPEAGKQCYKWVSDSGRELVIKKEINGTPSVESDPKYRGTYNYGKTTGLFTTEILSKIGDFFSPVEMQHLLNPSEEIAKDLIKEVVGKGLDVMTLGGYELVTKIFSASAVAQVGEANLVHFICDMLPWGGKNEWWVIDGWGLDNWPAWDSILGTSAFNNLHNSKTFSASSITSNSVDVTQHSSLQEYTATPQPVTALSAEEGLMSNVTVSFTNVTDTDANSNSHIDFLTVKTNIDVEETQTYYCSGDLYTETGKRITSVFFQKELTAGSNTVDFVLSGYDIFDSKSNAPYYFCVSIADANGLPGSDDAIFEITSHQYADFEGSSATFTGNYTDTGKDTNGDRKFDTLTVNAEVSAARSGRYEIVAYLADINGNFAGYTSAIADLSAGVQNIALDFDMLYLSEGGQWIVSWIQLTDADSGKIFDRQTNVYHTAHYDSSEFDTPLLAEPLNLRFVQAGKTALAFDWNDSPNAILYELQRENNSGGFTTIYTGTDSAFADTGLTLDTEYRYRVRSLGTEGYSAFSTVFTAKTLDDTVSDVPMITGAEIIGNMATLEWANLGTEYTYYIFKNGTLVTSQGQSETTYMDNNPPITTKYIVYAYNNLTGEWTKSLPTVLTRAPIKAEFVSHEVTPEGGIKLNWNIPELSQFVVFRNGIPVSGNVSGQTWTDTAPLPSASGNQYVLYVNYLDNEGNSFWTWSSTYVVQKPAAASAASSLDAFWAEYDSVVDDEVLTNIV